MQTAAPAETPREPVIGDVVTLKSGGPAMTVNGIAAKNAECTWFNEAGAINSGSFRFEALKIGEVKAEPKPEPVPAKEEPDLDEPHKSHHKKK